MSPACPEVYRRSGQDGLGGAGRGEGRGLRRKFQSLARTRDHREGSRGLGRTRASGKVPEGLRRTRGHGEGSKRSDVGGRGAWRGGKRPIRSGQETWPQGGSEGLSRTQAGKVPEGLRRTRGPEEGSKRSGQDTGMAGRGRFQRVRAGHGDGEKVPEGPGRTRGTLTFLEGWAGHGRWAP